MSEDEFNEEEFFTWLPVLAALCMMLFLLLLCGCATVDKGRFSVIDLDLRTPQQIEASIAENTCIYNCTNKVSQVKEEEPRAFPFELLFRFLEVVKGRIRIISLEWKTKE